MDVFVRLSASSLAVFHETSPASSTSVRACSSPSSSGSSNIWPASCSQPALWKPIPDNITVPATETVLRVFLLVVTGRVHRRVRFLPKSKRMLFTTGSSPPRARGTLQPAHEHGLPIETNRPVGKIHLDADPRVTSCSPGCTKIPGGYFALPAIGYSRARRGLQFRHTPRVTPPPATVPPATHETCLGREKTMPRPGLSRLLRLAGKRAVRAYPPTATQDPFVGTTSLGHISLFPPGSCRPASNKPPMVLTSLPGNRRRRDSQLPKTERFPTPGDLRSHLRLRAHIYMHRPEGGRAATGKKRHSKITRGLGDTGTGCARPRTPEL